MLCGVSGVQSQSITVDRQMKRYSVPRIAFINKLDRQGSNPQKVVQDLRNKLQLNAAAIHVPLGLEDQHRGIVDVVTGKAYEFHGEFGEKMVEVDMPKEVEAEYSDARSTLIEVLADVNDEIAELFLVEEEPTEDQIHEAIRDATVNLKFVPVMMGSAFKNKGVQPLLVSTLWNKNS